MKFFLRITLLACVALFMACGEEETEAPTPTSEYTRRPTADYAVGRGQKEAPAVRFVETAVAAGIEFKHDNGARGDRWMPETMGSGCALFDYDGDGALDVLLVNSGGWHGESSPSRLYRNLGDGTFVDVSDQTGFDFTVYGMGATVADYDADGDADIYLTTLGPNLLLRNDQGRFVDVAEEAGVTGTMWIDDAGNQNPEWSTGAAWFDVDGDGWLDLLATNYVRWSPGTDIYTSLDGKEKSYATPQQYPGSTPRLYRNLGDGRFEEITEAAGLLLPGGKSMGVAMTDFEGDGLVDIVVTNDTQPNFLLRNIGAGRFEERGLAAGIGYDETGRAKAGMGVDIASVENDGVLSIAIGNFSREALSLYRQAAGAVFVDAAGKARLVQSTLRPLTFGLRFFDYDLDGWQDLILANGHIEPGINSVQKEIDYAQAPQLFWNAGGGQLLDASEKTGGLFSRPLVARGLAVGDLDADGDLDVLMSSNSGPAYLLRNDGPTGNAVALDLTGTAPNLDAIGTVVKATVGDQVQTRMVRTGSSYLSHSSTTLTFGLGKTERIDRLQIRWPDGSLEELQSVAAGARYEIVQGKGIVGNKAFVR
jgi:hypothetical protein